MNKFCILLFISILSFNIFQLNAVPAIPRPLKVQQTDGSFLTVLLKGDEFFHYQTTNDGYPIVKNINGNYNYAKIDLEGKTIDTQVKASDKEQRSLTEAQFVQALKNEESLQEISKVRRAKRSLPASVAKPAKFPTNGTPHSLVILVNFSDLSFVVPNPQTEFTNLLNQENYSDNGGTGSAKDYFRDNSMEVFNPQFDVVGPFNLSKPYSYYGKNDNYGDDQNPLQMVVDACTSAYQNGVDFSKYDTDNDGYVDNVFIYYAGYNEAEWGNSNTIWPHRWGIYPTSLFGSNGNYSGTVASITFNGKIIMDYACTSELKGNSGNNMCGISTFCHEFGHVLGLVDFYATNGKTHHTLSDWDIMDGGTYLNDGRTPPAYSGHERFYLGWLTPIELKKPQNVVLKPIVTSNKAYIITQNGNSNLDGANPNPTEYFILENRQKTGWDTYLPGHGLLITRVNYNADEWNNNSPNNDPNNMRVDIIEADNIANDNSLAGDPFPGTSNTYNYTPVLSSGTKLDKPITEISEGTDGLVTFYYGNLANKALRYSIVDNNSGKILVYLPQDELNDLYIYDVSGRLFQRITANNLIEVDGLRKKVIYLLKSGSRTAKVLFY